MWGKGRRLDWGNMRFWNFNNRGGTDKLVCPCLIVNYYVRFVFTADVTEIKSN